LSDGGINQGGAFLCKQALGKQVLGKQALARADGDPPRAVNLAWRELYARLKMNRPRSGFSPKRDRFLVYG
jgi:hypothetical protein